MNDPTADNAKKRYVNYRIPAVKSRFRAGTTWEAQKKCKSEAIDIGKVVKVVTLTSSMELYTDATATTIDAMRKSARSIVTLGPMESIFISRFSGPLPSGNVF